MQNLIDNAKQRSDPATWNPPFCGDLDLEIRRDGRWFYMNSLIQRPEIVQLFAGILRNEGNDYFLVTPVEKVRIRVQDAPFVIVDYRVVNQTFLLRDNLDHEQALENSAQLYFMGHGDHARPYLQWRNHLSASFSHAVYYDLCELALKSPRHLGQHGLFSAGQFFSLEPQ